jgi:hypothetical protein
MSIIENLTVAQIKVLGAKRPRPKSAASNCSTASGSARRH